MNKKCVQNIKITKQHSERWDSLRLAHFVSAIIATHEDPMVASLNLQEHLHTIEKWLKKWKIKVNESKSSHINFTLRKGHCPAVNINQTLSHLKQKQSTLMTTLRVQVKLESTHRQKKKTNRLKNERDQLVNRKKNPISL